MTQAIRYHVSRLPHIGSPVPAKWTVVRDSLEKDSRNTITLQDYWGICKENSIKKIDDALYQAKSLGRDRFVAIS